MAPKRGGGASSRGRGRRGRGGRTPRSSRGGRRGAAATPSLSCADEGVWRYDFLLRILSRTATRIPLPFSFASVIFELNLRGLWLRLQGCTQSPAWVVLSVDVSFLIFLDAGWRSFSRQLNLCDGDSLCCRFDGEDNLIVRAFDIGGNRLDPYWEETDRKSTRLNSSHG